MLIAHGAVRRQRGMKISCRCCRAIGKSRLRETEVCLVSRTRIPKYYTLMATPIFGENKLEKHLRLPHPPVAQNQQFELSV